MVGKTPRCFAEGAAPGLLTLTSAVSAVGLSFRGAVFVYPAGDASGDAGGGFFPGGESNVGWSWPLLVGVMNMVSD